MRFRRCSFVSFVPLVVVSAMAFPLSAATCENLATLALPGVTITSVEAVPEGNFALSGGRGGPRSITDLPAFCRVVANLEPTAESNIGIELWMPAAADWNGKYVAVGNGAFAGSIGTNAMLDPLRRGYATSSTDTGHEGNQGRFALDEELLIDFAYRAVHEMAVQSKAMIESFYEVGPRYSFFNGCSTGGRQALTAAQRYPLDFDGIVAGAPAIYASRLQGAQVWMGRLGATTPGGPFPGEKLPLLHELAVDSCDMDDGVADGVIGRPGMCRFDPGAAAYRCASGSDPGACLTDVEARIAERMYRGPRTAAGASLFPGLAPGSELQWGGIMGPEPMSLAVEVYRYFVHKDEEWDYETFEVEPDVAMGARVIGKSMDAVDPDLREFVQNGGKLLVYHGWADWGISPYNSVNYYQSVVDTMGAPVRDSARLFMLPGVGHCRGGEGPDTWDSLEVIDQWVETGAAPDRIVASRIRDGAIDRTRPLCAYPAVAVYTGRGSTDEETSFVCR